jgi:SprT-like family
MPYAEHSAVGQLWTSSALREGHSVSKSDENCVVQTKNHCSLAQTISEKTAQGDFHPGFTAVEYRTFQNAFDYFNEVLFSAVLPQVLITLQRRPRARGYFCADRFQSRGPVDRHVHEVALNPNYFRDRSDKEILSTLVHEMVHVWQKEFGRAGRGRYHNRQWAGKMRSIGLMPSTTGKPGGRVIGDSISHYVIAGAEFDAECDKFLDRYGLVWESATRGTVPAPKGGAQQTRAKFSCPNCGLNAWAKPDAQLLCHRCSIEAHEFIQMLNSARPRLDVAKP